MAKPPAGRHISVPTPIKRKGSRSYYIRIKVPQGAREVLEKTELWRSLETEDLAVARARAVVEAGRMREQIEAARRNSDGTRKDAKGDPTAEQRKAEAWWMERRVPDPQQSGRYVIPEDLEAAWDAAVEELAGEPVNDDDGVSGPRYDPDRERAALALVGKVRGTVVPIAEELDRYMAQEGVKASYAARTRAATKALTDWLTANRHADNIQSVTGRVADQFADSAAEGRTVKTLNSYISALSAYWTWMKKRHVVDANPWVAADDDPYAVPGVPDALRDVVKIAMMQLLNAQPGRERVKAPPGATARLAGRMSYKALAARLEARHGGISNWFREGLRGLELQAIDAAIANAVLSYFTVAMKRPVLPVHDSFIVARRDERKLAEAMALAYRGQLSRRVDNPVLPVIRGFSSNEQEADFLAFVARWS
jgi:hypothetical protein